MHARAGATYLTGVHCKKTGGTDVRCGISVDQIAARKISAETRFPSIELGCDDTRTVGVCDSGYSCAYQNTLSWRTETSPLPPETNPRAVFERLFGSGDPNLPADVRARRAAARSSILDLVREDTQRIHGEVGHAGRRKIDEYLYAVREVEKQMASTEKAHVEYTGMIEKPAGVPVLFKDYLKVMFDLQILALQGDLTRVITMMYGREGSQRTYGEIGIPEPHHPDTSSRESGMDCHEHIVLTNQILDGPHSPGLGCSHDKFSDRTEGRGSEPPYAIPVLLAGIRGSGIRAIAGRDTARSDGNSGTRPRPHSRSRL